VSAKPLASQHNTCAPVDYGADPLQGISMYVQHRISISDDLLLHAGTQPLHVRNCPNLSDDEVASVDQALAQAQHLACAQPSATLLTHRLRHHDPGVLHGKALARVASSLHGKRACESHTVTAAVATMAGAAPSQASISQASKRLRDMRATVRCAACSDMQRTLLAKPSRLGAARQRPDSMHAWH
jgi:hypothetical protein